VYLDKIVYYYLTLIWVEVQFLFRLIVRDALQSSSISPGFTMIITQDTEDPITSNGTVATHHQMPLVGWITFL